MVPQFMLIAPPIDDPAPYLDRFTALAETGALAVALLNVTAGGGSVVPTFLLQKKD